MTKTIAIAIVVGLLLGVVIVLSPKVPSISDVKIKSAYYWDKTETYVSSISTHPCVTVHLHNLGGAGYFKLEVVAPNGKVILASPPEQIMYDATITKILYLSKEKLNRGETEFYSVIVYSEQNYQWVETDTDRITVFLK